MCSVSYDAIPIVTLKAFVGTRESIHHQCQNNKSIHKSKFGKIHYRSLEESLTIQMCQLRKPGDKHNDQVEQECSWLKNSYHFIGSAS